MSALQNGVEYRRRSSPEPDYSRRVVRRASLHVTLRGNLCSGKFADAIRLGATAETVFTKCTWRAQIGDRFILLIRVRRDVGARAAGRGAAAAILLWCRRVREQFGRVAALLREGEVQEMARLRSGMLLAGAVAALLFPAAGAAARNIRAKPQPAACAAARAQGQFLPGCPQPDRLDRDVEAAPPAPPPSPTAREVVRTQGSSARDQ